MHHMNELISIKLPKQSGETVVWSSLFGSSRSLAICQAALKHNTPLLVIVPDLANAAQIEGELHFYAAGNKLEILTFPDWETLPYDQFSPHQDIISERLLVLHKILTLKRGIVIVAANTAMHRLAPAEYIKAYSFVLHKGDELDVAKLRTDLINRGYYLVNQVMEHGEFAIRGSIVDIFPMGSSVPYRIDLFDNDVDSIRTFDLETQKSQEPIDKIRLLPAREFALNEEAITRFKAKWQEQFPRAPIDSLVYENVAHGIASAGIEYYLPLFFNATQTIFDYLPTNSLVVSVGKITEATEHFWLEVNDRYEQLRHDINNPILDPEQIFIKPKDWQMAAAKFKLIAIDPASEFITKQLPNLTIDKLPDFLQKKTERVLFCAESMGRREALLNILSQIDLQPVNCANWHEFLQSEIKYGITLGELEAGLLLKEIIVIPEAELFSHQVMQRRLRQSGSAAISAENMVRDLSELHVGDPVVHVEHGIGRYLGLQTIAVGEQPAEYLTIEYADAAKLYVPIASLHLVGRYFAADADNVIYNHLGSKRWDKVKRKALEKIYDVAAELLDIYARRAVRPGYVFSQPEADYQKFISKFPFETTPDQQKAINEVISDMTSPHSMDRLICGDVGFGKTEVAMRAAFLAAHDNKQVVILVPTTLLAQQHYDNFCDRFAAWPIKIGMLSRFTTAKEQANLLEQLSAGKLDIVIGTHRLLQPDIKFKDLGLLIIDEEHRFGVKQKEKVKSLRANVDILTLTATPIPRTLSMALAGIRDLSIIATPPARRLSIKTFVRQKNNQLIREAILREILRGGQVYFLHNDVATIERTAEELRKILPEAKIEIGHAQMHERQLEGIMRNFYHRQFNVLVCTTIIESGIDIPTANTIIINRADRLGLAQLHQLRGRVGRSHHQAYAYLLVPPPEALTKDATKRLAAIEEMEDLGAGFILATYDLEIRGAGEILGEDQSGQIQAIGFNLYVEFLDDAVKVLKSGKKLDLDKPFLQHTTEIDLPLPALIPDKYVYDVNTRLTLYKSLANVKTAQELHDFQVDLIDRFGLLPEPTKNLCAIAELRLQAENLGITKIKANLTQGYLEFIEKPKIDPKIIINLIQKQPNKFKLLNRGSKLQFNLEAATAQNLIDQIAGILNLFAQSPNRLF
jgi:transcription-repair coupling factor (superfamily II helicase)